MRVLIDTHVLLWGLQYDARLSRRAGEVLTTADVWISVASLWEIITKVQIGKLGLPKPVSTYLTSRLAANGVSILPLTLDHVMRLEEIPLHHRDPFDRILVAQGIEEDLPLITNDPLFRQYPIQVIW